MHQFLNIKLGNPNDNIIKSSSSTPQGMQQIGWKEVHSLVSRLLDFDLFCYGWKCPSGRHPRISDITGGWAHQPHQTPTHAHQTLELPIEGSQESHGLWHLHNLLLMQNLRHVHHLLHRTKASLGDRLPGKRHDVTMSLATWTLSVYHWFVGRNMWQGPISGSKWVFENRIWLGRLSNSSRVASM